MEPEINQYIASHNCKMIAGEAMELAFMAILEL